jgi:Putative transposase DNA-binding domain
MAYKCRADPVIEQVSVFNRTFDPTFRRMIEYKCERAGRHLIVISRRYPSSNTCSACG